MKPLYTAIGFSMLVSALPFTAHAMSDDPGPPPSNAGANVSAQAGANYQADKRFSQDEIRLIRDVLGAATGTDLSDNDYDDDDDDDRDHDKKKKKYKKDKSGKSKGLPPGIAKNWARGKPLPPGIAKRDLPDNLLAKLAKRENTRASIVGSDVVLEDVATGIIIDVIADVLTNQ